MTLLQPGAVLHGRYRIANQLAQGGFGTLYRAWDNVLGRPCALKENLDASPEAQRQFQREARILAGLSHPNLPRVSDYFTVLGQGDYLVMDYIEGRDLQEMLDERGGPLAESEVLPWVGQVCDALVYLHTQKPPVIHRDIKPGNIKITPLGQAMLIDFGIAKVYDPATKTTIGAQAVTPGYSPYEQYGKGLTDARTDLYALGATVYMLLTGQEPVESVQRVVRDPLAPPRQLNPAISLRTSGAVMRAMQIDPLQRFQTAADFKAALIAPAAARPAVPARPLRPLPPLAASAVSSPAGFPAAGAPAGTPPPGVPSAAQAPAGATASPPLLWISLVAVLALIIMGMAWALLHVDSSAGLPAGGASTASMLAEVPTETGAPTAQASGPAPAGTARPGSETPSLESPLASATPLAYTVQVGDTCSEIAQDYRVSIESITKLNNLPSECSFLYAGQTLLIPVETPGLPETVSAFRTITAMPTQITRLAPADGMVGLYITAGEFLMGSTEADLDARQDEKPQRSVYVGAFWIDQHEVTNGMYALCVAAKACRSPALDSSKTRDSYYDNPNYQNYPVTHVSWDAASAYCKWAGRRLPTEAEWEKAARGMDGRWYPWGNAPPSASLANFNRLVGDTQPVGSFPQGNSPYGAWEMAGNVAEWVADWYAPDYYLTSIPHNPPGPATGQFRVLRGGSWLNADHAIRAAFRLWNTPDVQSDSIGFRCAR